MLRIIVKIFFILFTSNCLLAQGDSSIINELNYFKDGLYLTHSDFRKNSPVTKENINTDINKEQLDFYFKTTTREKINYSLNGANYSIESKTIWGFVQNKTLFVNFNGAFYRVPVFGSICYFAGVVEVIGYYNGIYDPVFGPGGARATKTQEVREFLMNYYDGIVVSFSMSEAEKLIKRDEEVYAQFKKLSKRNRKKQVSRYIRMYNEKHPIYTLN